MSWSELSTLGPAVTIINNAKECDSILGEFVQSMGEMKMMGLDCEWVDAQNFAYKEQREYQRMEIRPDLDAIRKHNGSQGRVALLQLASHDGTALLIRLCFFTFIPQSLKALLEDGQLLKFGVNIEADVKKLFMDWEINTNGFVDIRNIVARNPKFLEEYHKSGLGLKKLCNFLTGSNWDESSDNSIRHSHWAARVLTAEQMEYARNDAIMAIQGIDCYATKYMDGLPHPSSGPPFFTQMRKAFCPHVNRTCSEFVTHILNRRDLQDDEEAMKKADQRRRRRRAADVDTSDSDVDLDYEAWKRSYECRKAQMTEGLERAVLFYDERNRPIAAIDWEYLDTLKNVEEPQKLCFDVKNENGTPIYETKITLTKRST